MFYARLEVKCALIAGAVCLLLGCGKSGQNETSASAAVAASSVPARGLSAEDAKLVLAKVGDVSITLGDYAAALDRMDRFERLRYQTEDRRQQLLDELINVELLAQEAKRRKLDEDPEVRLRLDEALRDEVLRDLRSSVPTPESLPVAEVRAYYDSHRDEFKEPERRRVAAVAVTDEAKARVIIEQAQSVDPAGWGELVRKHSILPRPAEQTPLELEGDLGIVSAPGAARGNGPRLSETIVAALFEIKDLGGIYPKPVRDGQRFYVLRLTGRTDARERSFSEAERSIRVRMVEQRLVEAEAKLLDELRRQYPVNLDENALARATVTTPPSRGNVKNALDH